MDDFGGQVDRTQPVSHYADELAACLNETAYISTQFNAKVPKLSCTVNTGSRPVGMPAPADELVPTPVQLDMVKIRRGLKWNCRDVAVALSKAPTHSYRQTM